MRKGTHGPLFSSRLTGFAAAARHLLPSGWSAEPVTDCGEGECLIVRNSGDESAEFTVAINDVGFDIAMRVDHAELETRKSLSTEEAIVLLRARIAGLREAGRRGAA